MAIRELNVKLNLDARQFTKGLKDAKKGLDSLSNTSVNVGINMQNVFAGIGKAALGLVTVQKIIEEVGVSIKNAMTIESSTQSLTYILGDSSAALIDWANNSALAFNMSEKQAIQYGATYSNLLSSFIDDTDNAEAYTEKLLQSAAVVSSATGRTVEDTLGRIRSGLVGNTESIEDLGIFVNVAMIEATDAFKKFAGDKSWDQLDYKTQSQIRLMAILEQASSKYGTSVLDNTSSAYAQMTAQLDNGLTELGQALLPLVNIIIPVLVGAIEIIKPPIIALAGGISLVAGVIGGMAEPLKQLAVAVVVVVVAVKLLNLALATSWGWLVLVAGGLMLLGLASEQTKKNATTLEDTGTAADGAKKSVDDLSESTDKLADSAKGLAAFDEINKLSGNKTTGSLGSSLITDEDLANALDYSDTIADVQSQVDGLTGGENTVDFGINMPDIARTLKKVISNWVPFWKDIGEDIHDLFFGSADDSYNALVDLNDKVKEIFGSNWTDFWNKTGSDIYDAFVLGENNDIYKWLEDKTISIKLLFGDDWVNFWEKVGAGIQEAFSAGEGDKFYTYLKSANDRIRELFGSGWTDFWYDVGAELYEALNPTSDPQNQVETKGGGGRNIPYEPNSYNAATDYTSRYSGAYASGGFPTTGQFFIARENGPELVGKMGNSTAVANNEQITTGIYNAVLQALKDGSSGNNSAVNNKIYLDGDLFYEVMTNADKREKNRSNGR